MNVFECSSQVYKGRLVSIVESSGQTVVCVVAFKDLVIFHLNT